MNSVNINPPQTGDILDVDDTAANVKLLADLLGEAGYQVRSAANGESALRNVQAKQLA